jgi:hypothetical protein
VRPGKNNPIARKEGRREGGSGLSVVTEVVARALCRFARPGGRRSLANLLRVLRAELQQGTQELLRIYRFVATALSHGLSLFPTLWASLPAAQAHAYVWNLAGPAFTV